jgi:hypothetical protein
MWIGFGGSSFHTDGIDDKRQKFSTKVLKSQKINLKTSTNARLELNFLKLFDRGFFVQMVCLQSILNSCIEGTHF